MGSVRRDEGSSAPVADEAMERYARGDDRAFVVVYDDLAPRLQRYLLRKVRTPALVEDIVQQTFLQMHSKRGTFSPGAQVVPWAFCIAKNFMIDLLRKSRREPVVALTEDDECAWLIADVPTGEQIIHARQARILILSAFGSLPEHHRAAFELTKGDGLSQEEAAQLLGKTVMSVKMSVHKVYEKLRSALAALEASQDSGHPSDPITPIDPARISTS